MLSMLRQTSAMLNSTTTSIMIATSPKRVSMSTIATLLFVFLAERGREVG